MDHLPLLSATTFLPLLGAVLILFTRGEPEVVARNARWTALWASLITFLLSVRLWLGFDLSTHEFQFVEKAAWIPAFDIGYHMGIDGISLFFVLLTTFLTPLCVLASWEAIKARVKEYMIAFLIMETLLVGMFCALDFVVFYILFEGVLVPMFLIIGVWGGPQRVYAAFKFFLFTFLGSVLMLLGILAIYFQVGTTDIPAALAFHFSREFQIWLWLAFFASFAVKLPMWPVHTWLPDAHVEAPTAGSVILAGVMLKMGGYGFLRFSVPMLPEASAYFTPFVFTLSVVAVIYTSFVALAQEDMKKLIAYSSVAHMGIVTMGIFAVTPQAVEGAMIQMLSHGVVSASLFLCVGVVYDRMHSRLIATYGGLVHRMPLYAAAFMLFMLASVGLPGTSGFVGEFMALLGTFRVSTWTATLGATGMILGVAYMLWLYRRVIFGPLTKPELQSILDLSPREVAVFAPIALVVLWMGVYPTSFLDPLHATIGHTIGQYKAGLAAAGLPPGAARVAAIGTAP